MAAEVTVVAEEVIVVAEAVEVIVEVAAEEEAAEGPGPGLLVGAEGALPEVGGPGLVQTGDIESRIVFTRFDRETIPLSAFPCRFERMIFTQHFGNSKM